MALSGSYDYSLTGTKLIATAHRKLGISSASTTQNTNALEALELILKSLSAKGYSLRFPWAQEWITQALTESTASYTMNAKVAHIEEAFIRRSSNDTAVIPMSNEEYARIGTKTTEGIPNRMWIDKQNDGYVVYLDPVPENSTDVLHLLVVNKVQDMDSAANDIDINTAWYEALTYTLAARLGPEPGINASTVDIDDLIVQAKLLTDEAMGVTAGSGSTFIRTSR
jgi:hypothetical protein